MTFNTSYKPAPSLAEPECPKVRQRYKLNKATHNIELQDKEPFYEQIQSYADSASLSSVLSRVQMGDVSALSSSSGEYLDISGVPNNLAALHEVGKLSGLFTNLPEDIRGLFGNSQSVFSVCLANGTAERIIKSYSERKPKPGAGTGTATGAGTGGADNEPK